MKGFSLIELLLVIAIVLVLGTMSTVFYSRFLTQNNVSNVSDQLAGQLRKAQIYALAGKQNTNWGVRYLDNKITLFAVGNSAFDESFDVTGNIAIAGFAQVIFTKATGIPDTTFTAVISGNSDTRNVTLNNQGVVGR